MTNQERIINAWYVNKTGKLMKLRLMCYEAGQLEKVLLEYLEGTTTVISIEAWNKLDLDIHKWAPGAERNVQ